MSFITSFPCAAAAACTSSLGSSGAHPHCVTWQDAGADDAGAVMYSRSAKLAELPGGMTCVQGTVLVMAHPQLRVAEPGLPPHPASASTAAVMMMIILIFIVIVSLILLH